MKYPSVIVVGSLWLATACGNGSPTAVPVSPEASESLEASVSTIAPTSVSPLKDKGSASYILRFDGSKNHYLQVQANFPTKGEAKLELMMPVWTPGSYLVREFARHIESFSARSPKGRSLAFSKTSKNRYAITTKGAPFVVVRYRLYAREATVRTNFVDTDHAVINGAPTFLAKVGDSELSYSVKLVLPKGWASVQTALAPHPDGEPNQFLAPDFDTLVDSPILAGNPKVYTFEVAGKQHALVHSDEQGVWDGPRSAQDVEALVRAQLRFWGQAPYDRYVFLNVINETRGGLEHKDSTLMMTSRWTTHSETKYRGWLGLVSHEFFHTWNGKRLRPVALGPFDYESEVYTKDLWIVEGLTSYYDDLLLVRAGLMTKREYLDVIGAHIKRLKKTPGRAVQPIDMASYDAWIKFYRADENTHNSAVSYYTKGALIGFLLDAYIRRATREKRSLDDLMRSAYQQYSGEQGYTSDEFYALVESIAGRGVRRRLRRMVQRAGDLNYRSAFEWYGLEFVPDKDPGQPQRGPAALERKRKRSALGVDTDGHLRIRKVHRGGAGYEAGLNAGDELIAINGFRIKGKLSSAIGRYTPGETLKLLIARRGQMRTLDVTLKDANPDQWKVRVRTSAPAPARRHFDALLSRR